MKKTTLLTGAIFLFAFQNWADAALINATAKPDVAVLATNQEVTIPVNIDLGQLPEALGSFTAKLTWDPTVLEFINNYPGQSTEFSNLTFNQLLVKKGQIRFAGVNPYGASGKLNVLNLSFKVIGSVGTSPNIQLEFTAMAAAKTFEDLMPYLETVNTSVEKVGELPDDYQLEQNYPNPFNPSTSIHFSLPERTRVSLKVFNSVGQEIVTLVNEVKSPGQHVVIWDSKDSLGKNVPAGIYLYRLTANDFEQTHKMLLVR